MLNFICFGSAAMSSQASSVPGVAPYEPHMNPANWMLEVTSPAAEAALGVDFGEVWAASEQARSVQQLEHAVAQNAWVDCIPAL